MAPTDSKLKQGVFAVPQDREDRDLIRATVRQFVEQRRLQPPLPLNELRKHADNLLRALDMNRQYRDFVTVLVSNAVWAAVVASVPFERRLLILPQCLREKQHCPADIVETGILCKGCGRCSLGALVEEAERLGYTVLITKGTALVSQLADQGKVDAVVGAGCLMTLDRSIPHWTADAVPGIAVPLLTEACDGAEVDLDWLYEAMQLRSGDDWAARVDIEAVRGEVSAWFSPTAIRDVVHWGASTTEEIALNWLAISGKRWRPLLAACIYRLLAKSGGEETPSTMKRLAIAVECFHKASLVHDDIEDDDDFRYGEETVHRRYGIPIALNVGDYLLGEGYRIIAQTEANPEQRARMLAVAAEGHRNLALGQGQELAWSHQPSPLSTETIIEIFEHKTAPAFEVALNLGAIFAGADERTCGILSEFSRALGIAYQIQDDLKDYFHDEGRGDGEALRPNILLSLALEAARGRQREQLNAIWSEGGSRHVPRADIVKTVAGLGVEQHARQLFKHYRSQAMRRLNPLRDGDLKDLLHRLTGRILTGA